jgi:ATP adenylyltransferase
VSDAPKHDQQPHDAVQRLWAPWRYAYVANAEPLDGCPFCVLPARAPEQDDTSLILYRGTYNVVMLNAYPYNPGHLMVLPYSHTADLQDLDAPVATELFALTQRCVAVLTDRLHCSGVNLGMNLGAAAGAGIADHLHMHAVPRWAGDTNFLTVAGNTRVLPRALGEMYHELADGFLV